MCDLTSAFSVYLQALPSESSLECPICTNQYETDGIRQPKILKCGHTLCTGCVKQILDPNSNQVKCPYCFVVTTVGIMGIYGFPVNRTLVDILNNLNLVDAIDEGAAPRELCCYCDKSEATKICFGCDPSGCKLCDECCAAEHSRPFAPVRAHKPLNISDVKNIPKHVCTVHGHPFTHYSEKAATFGCRKCLEVLPGDIDVEFLPIDAAIQMLRQRLPMLTESLERYLKRLQDAQRNMIIMQADLGVAETKAMKDVQQKFSMFHKLFQDRQKSLLATLGTVVSSIHTLRKAKCYDFFFLKMCIMTSCHVLVCLGDKPSRMLRYTA